LAGTKEKESRAEEKRNLAASDRTQVAKRIDVLRKQTIQRDDNGHPNDSSACFSLAASVDN
jgi:DNA-binding XRE family transcriptional regulator